MWKPPDGRPVERRVALFTGCIMSTAFAETTEATARLLARRGCEVVAVEGQGCCGALHLHSGEVDGARRLARGNVAAFNPDDFDAIIVNSAGCGSTLKGYGHLLDGDEHERALPGLPRFRIARKRIVGGAVPLLLVLCHVLPHASRTLALRSSGV